jgi:hypothetical protein
MYSLAQQAAAASHSTVHHAMASGAPDAFDLMLVALGVVAVIVTTIYSVLYLICPAETEEDHIKRRILEDGKREFR